MAAQLDSIQQSIANIEQRMRELEQKDSGQ